MNIERPGSPSATTVAPMSKLRSTSIETRRSRLASERPPKKGVAIKNAFRSGELAAIYLICSRSRNLTVVYWPQCGREQMSALMSAPRGKRRARTQVHDLGLRDRCDARQLGCCGKQAFERLALYRLFQNFDERVAPVDAFAAVSRHKHERDSAIEQAIGDRIDELATQIDVEDRSLRRIVLDGPHGVRHACAGRRDTDAEIRQLILQDHRDQRLILDDQNALARKLPR